MIDWNTLAEKHKLGSTDVERTLTLVCREMAGLVPQELPMPGEPVVGAPSNLPKAPPVMLTEASGNSATWSRPSTEGEDSASG